VTAVGWDGFLTARSGVFVMHATAPSGYSQSIRSAKSRDEQPGAGQRGMNAGTSVASESIAEEDGAPAQQQQQRGALSRRCSTGAASVRSVESGAEAGGLQRAPSSTPSADGAARAPSFSGPTPLPPSSILLRAGSGAPSPGGMAALLQRSAGGSGGGPSRQGSGFSALLSPRSALTSPTGAQHRTSNFSVHEAAAPSQHLLSLDAKRRPSAAGAPTAGGVPRQSWLQMGLEDAAEEPPPPVPGGGPVAEGHGTESGSVADAASSDGRASADGSVSRFKQLFKRNGGKAGGSTLGGATATATTATAGGGPAAALAAVAAAAAAAAIDVENDDGSAGRGGGSDAGSRSGSSLDSSSGAGIDYDGAAVFDSAFEYFQDGEAADARSLAAHMAALQVASGSHRRASDTMSSASGGSSLRAPAGLGGRRTSRRSSRAGGGGGTRSHALSVAGTHYAQSELSDCVSVGATAPGPRAGRAPSGTNPYRSAAARRPTAGAAVASEPMLPQSDSGGSRRGGEAGAAADDAGADANGRSAAIEAGDDGGTEGGGDDDDDGGSQMSTRALHLRALEADRATILEGRQPAPGRLRLCVRWLDELVVATWHDLQAFREWRLLDQALQRSRGLTLAGALLGLPPRFPGGGAAPPGPPPAVATPTLSPLDWMRRGLLAERLGNRREAIQCHSAAIKAGFSLTSCVALVRLYAQAGLAKLALQAMLALLDWHERRAPFHRHRAVPPSVQAAMATLLSHHTPPAVLDAVRGLSAGPAHPAIGAAIAACDF